MVETLSPRRLVITAGFLSLLIAWDASGLDMALAHWFGDRSGFPLSGHWLLSRVLHEWGRLLAWGVVTGLTLMVWWPVGWLRELQVRERVQLVVSPLLSVLVISSMKGLSQTSCPWDLADFGGAAHLVSHWVWQSDGGAGHCFPAGHASSGFAFIGGYFALRRHSVQRARLWLLVSVAVGLALGLAQQARGAHFMSHTLWTAWLCWCMAWAVDFAMRWYARRVPAPRADMDPC